MSIQFFGKENALLNLWVIAGYSSVSIEANRNGRRIRARINQRFDYQDEVNALASEVVALFREGGMDALLNHYQVVDPVDKGEAVVFEAKPPANQERITKW